MATTPTTPVTPNDWTSVSAPGEPNDWRTVTDEPSKPQDSFLDKAGHLAEDIAYPTIGALLGAAVTAETGPGMLAGGSLGATAGTALKREMRTLRGRDDLNPHGAGEVGEYAGDALGGGMQTFSKAVPAVGKIINEADAYSPKIAGAMNQFLGLKASNLAKYERMVPGSASEVGGTVYKEAGLQPTLQAQKDAIDAAIARHVGKTADILNSGGAPIDMHELMLHHGLDLIDTLTKEGKLSDSATRAIEANIDSLKPYQKTLSPAEALEMRRAIKPSNFDPETDNIGQRFRQSLYHGINDSLEGALSPEDAEAFRSNNRTVNRLILGSQAAGKKLVSSELKAPGAPQTLFQTAAKRAMQAGGAGALLGAHSGPGGLASGAVGGALTGAAEGTLEHALSHLTPEQTARILPFINKSAQNIIPPATYAASQ